MTDAFRRNNHYVPQTYLKQWGDNNGRVWAYRVLVSNPNVPLWKRASIKGLPCHAHLYTQLAATELTDEIERWLDTDFEAPAGNIIQKVVSESRLTQKDWAHLIRFLAAQDVRTPARLMEMLQRWSNTMPQFLEDTLEATVQELEAAKRVGVSHKRNDNISATPFPIRITTELIPNKDYGIVRAETVVGRGLFLFALKHLLTNTVNVLLSHKWTILQAPVGIEWLTSDDPVVRLNYHNPMKYDFGGGWGSPGKEIFLPLSPRHLLYSRVGTKPPKRGSVLSKEIAGQFQRFIIEHGHRQIIGTSQQESVPLIRPRTIDPEMFNREVQQWKNWHDEQTNAELDLKK